MFHAWLLNPYLPYHILNSACSRFSYATRVPYLIYKLAGILLRIVLSNKHFESLSASRLEHVISDKLFSP